MKLAIVTAFPPSKVTLNEYGYHLVNNFKQKDQIDEIILMTDHTNEDKASCLTDEGCKVTVYECWKFNSYTNVLSITKTIRQTEPDIVLFNLQFMKFGDNKVAAALGLTLPLICKTMKLPNVVLLHNIMEEVDLSSAGFTTNKLMQKLYGLIGSILTRLILQADKVALTIDKYVRTLENKYKKKNLALIPHGTFEEIEEEPSYLLPSGPFQVMAFGKFGTYKKVESMIEAVEKVRKNTCLDIEVVIAGTDNPNTPGYLENVKNKYEHVPKLRFTGYVEEKDVAEIFKESAVVVFPYTATTGSSGVLHQAGSYGKAVVMPNIGDLTDMIEDEGYQGEYFDPNSIESLASAIEKILTRDDHRIELGRTNFRAATAYPMNRITEMYIKEFNNIIDLKRKRQNQTHQIA